MGKGDEERLRLRGGEEEQRRGRDEERRRGREEERRRGGEEDRSKGGKERMRGGGGRALFLVMQVLEIPAGGRGFPLVLINAPVFEVFGSFTE